MSDEMLPAKAGEAPDRKTAILSTVLNMAPGVLGVAGEVVAAKKAERDRALASFSFLGQTPTEDPSAIRQRLLDRAQARRKRRICLGVGAVLIGGGLGTWWWLGR